MASYAYHSIRDQFQQLPLEDQLRLLADLAAIVRDRQTMPGQKHSILELGGLGKDIWEGFDIDQYAAK